MALLESDGQRRDVPLAESGRCVKAQVALQPVALAVQRLFRFVDRRQNRFEALIITAAGLGQETARCCETAAASPVPAPDRRFAD